jgi:4-diphosphocytidyl-2-C-methyl-D-erythritol kinase
MYTNGTLTLAQLMPRPHAYRACVAKINVGLFIKGKRPDGYHELETLFVPCPELYDDLTITAAADEPEHVLLASGCPVLGDLHDHLVIRAYELLRQQHPELPNLRIRLHKRIPLGAGLGGGSSNAANLLLAANELFQLGYTATDLLPLARQLGADVPFFLVGTPSLATGIGDELQPYPMPQPFQVRVVTPGIHSDTRLAYQGLNLAHCHTTHSLREALAHPPEAWPQVVFNDFEPSVFARFPLLERIKAKLYEDGAIFASLSGSGSAVFGLFPA